MLNDNTSQSVTRPTVGLRRCFYAITLPTDMMDSLAQTIEELRRHGADIRWTPRANIHLSLRFLGELTAEQFERAEKLELPKKGFAPFSIAILGLGAFPGLRSPRILWAGIAGQTKADTDRLLHIQAFTEREARAIGVPPENRKYTPHITLGRVGRPGDGLLELMNEITVRDCRTEFHEIASVVLMESRMTGQGPVYEVLRRVALE